MKFRTALFANARDKRPGAVDDAISPDERGRSRGTIVVADDDTTTRMILCRILRKHGYRVVDVDNGKLACEAVRSEHPDAVLLDWSMPVMDGLAALRVLKADNGTSDIPVVMLTARTQVDERAVAIEAGVQGFLTKPCDSAELVTCVERYARAGDFPAELSATPV